MRTIDTQELKQKLDRNEDFIFLNVLPEEEFRKEHIPGSQNIPQDDDDFVENVKRKVPEKNTEIIVYCANKDCPASDKAAQMLEEAGYRNVADYEGGMQAWKDADYAVAA